MLIGSAVAVPYAGSFNATQQLEDAKINPNVFLGGARNNRTPDYIGARLQNTWEEMGNLYNKFLQNGRLDQAEMREFGTARKLLQLAHMVRETQTKNYLFERYCFYGCHCIPGLPVHDNSAGKGAPQDGIDGTCSHLRQCYLCAKDEHNGECDGATMSYSWRFLDTDNDGKTDNIQCTNREGSCRWKLCQCDRQFALEMRNHEEDYDEQYSEDDGFDREGICVAGGGSASEKSCCGNYQNNFRLIFNPNQQQCCGNSLPTDDLVKPIGECENPTN